MSVARLFADVRLLELLALQIKRHNAALAEEAIDPLAQWYSLCRLSLRERTFFRGAKDDFARLQRQSECHWASALPLTKYRT